MLGLIQLLKFSSPSPLNSYHFRPGWLDYNSLYEDASEEHEVCLTFCIFISFYVYIPGVPSKSRMTKFSTL